MPFETQYKHCDILYVLDLSVFVTSETVSDRRASSEFYSRRQISDSSPSMSPARSVLASSVIQVRYCHLQCITEFLFGLLRRYMFCWDELKCNVSDISTFTIALILL